MSSDVQQPSAPREPDEDLVFLYLEEREQGRCASLEEFAELHPRARDASVQERIRALEAAGLLVSADVAESFPERLGDFRLIERLGGGGMGVVFRAEQLSLGREVALKLIRPEQLYFPGAKERFRREVEAVARLAHPGIASVFACGEERGVPFYAMELVAGMSLGDVLRRLCGRSPASLTGRDLALVLGADASAPLFQRSWPEACVELARQVALALDHAHSRGVIHRDVKPTNVMLTPDGRALLVDFGLAAQRGSARLTGAGAQLGSTGYMSPEQARGAASEADARTDVYSLGVTLYELFTLRLPFAGAAITEIVERILDGRAEPCRRFNPSVSRDAQTVCATAMAPDKARRYASARLFADDLTNVLERRPIAVRPAGPLERLGRWSRRHPARATSVALAAALFVGGPLSYGVLQARAAERQRRLNTELTEANHEIARRGEGLEAANRDLGAALGREREERERAQLNFERALRSVDEMLAAVGADALADVPQMAPVRRELLEKALAFYEELLSEAPDHPALRRERARTERSVGDLLGQLGRYDEARERYEDAVGRLRELLDADPTVESRHALASVLGQLANQHSARGEGGRAEELWLEAVALLEQDDHIAAGRVRAGIDLVLLRCSLAYGSFARGDNEGSRELYLRSVVEGRRLRELAPLDTDLAEALAGALTSFAQASLHLGSAAEADRAYAEAFDLLEVALARAPRSVRLRSELVELSNNYGVRLMSGGDSARTERVLAGGFAAARSLAGEFPDDPEHAKRLAVIGVNLAVMFANERRFAEAAPVLDESAAALEELVARFPERVEFPYFLGANLANSAGVAEQLGRLELAEARSVRAVELLVGAVEATGGHTGVKASLASAYFRRASVRRASGDLAAALAFVERALDQEPRRADVVYEGVEVLGDCATDAQRAGALELEQRAVELGLELLGRAIEAGYGDAARLRESESLARLRTDPRFDELVAALDARER